MQLVINSYGSFLKKQQNCFLVKNEGKVFEVSANKVDSILMTTSATITTDAIKFAVENNIDIVFLDHFGDPYGRVWHSKLGSTVLIRRKQLEIANKKKGLKLARGWIEIKMNNQIEFLKDLKKNRPDKREELGEYISNIEAMKDKLLELDEVLDEIRGSIMGIEGMGSKHYFSALSYIMPEKWKFEGRSRNPAADEFNCLLNYGYGILYSMVEKACILSGLDPYVGFLHTDNYNKMSLVFDLIELYRIQADRTVVNLFSNRKINSNQFDPIPNGLTLNKEGKAVLLQAFNEAMEKKILHDGRNIKMKNIIQFDCHKIANSLIK